MPRTFAIQSRMASLMASLSVWLPDRTACTLEPSSPMRNTLRLWRIVSRYPMYTSDGSPRYAHAIAVATPCWPAPVSAITRTFPMRRASSACPSVLFILWAPPCSRSSRFRYICAPPTLSDRLAAWYSGVGLPAYSRRHRASSDRNAGSARAAR